MHLPSVEILRMMAASDPRGIATRLFDHVLRVLGIEAGAVLALHRGRLVSFVDRTTLDGLAAARALWDTALKDLEAGLKVACGTSCFIPLLLEGVLVGAVWLEGVPVSFADLGEVAVPLALAVTAPPAQLPGIEEILDRPEDEIIKERTLGLLARHEWNIARVARAMGVTRRTIYVRLEKWGIPRTKIPKTLRRLEPGEA